VLPLSLLAHVPFPVATASVQLGRLAGGSPGQGAQKRHRQTG